MAGVTSNPLPSGKYRGWYVDYTGKRRFFVGTRRRTGTAKNPGTLEIAQRLEDENRQIRLGYRPAPVSADKHRKRPFAEVAEEYVAWGRSQGGRRGRPWSDTHARNRELYLKFWEERLGLQELGDVDGVLPRMEKALRDLEKTRKPATLAKYAEALRALCQWCIARGYLLDDPLRGFVAYDTTPSFRRRAMTPEEIQRLLAKCAPHRRMVYEVAFASGLRKKELKSLTVDHLDTRRGGLRLDAEWTKNRKPGFQPLPRALVERLKEFADSGGALELYREAFAKAGLKPKEFAATALLYVPYHTSRDIAKDLKAAGIPQWTPEGKVDFHAARLAYINFVLESGATLKEAMQLARHSTPDLTLNTYGRTRPERLFALVEEVGKSATSSPECAHSVHSKAAGAEGVDVSRADKEVTKIKTGGGCRIRTHDHDRSR